MDYKPMIASSGEVYFTVNGNLQMVANLDEYKAMLVKKEKLETTYFELTIKGEYHKLLATRTAVIMHLIMQLPLAEQTAEIVRYQQTLEEVEQYV